MKFLRSIVVVFIIFMMIGGCNMFFSRFSSAGPFYRSTGGRDFLRIPLLKPYDVIKGDKEYGWTVDLDVSPSNDATYYISIKRIEKIAVEKGIIFIYTSYQDESAEGLGEKVLFWFVLNPEKGTERGFADENDFLKYIHEHQIQEPSWLEPDTVFQQFEKTGCLEWIPDCKSAK